MAEANGATNFEITKEFQATCSKASVSGVRGSQTIKGEVVQIRLCVLSVPEYSTDLLVHLGTVEEGQDGDKLDELVRYVVGSIAWEDAAMRQLFGL